MSNGWPLDEDPRPACAPNLSPRWGRAKEFRQALATTGLGLRACSLAANRRALWSFFGILLARLGKCRLTLQGDQPSHDSSNDAFHHWGKNMLAVRDIIDCHGLRVLAVARWISTTGCGYVGIAAGVYCPWSTTLLHPHYSCSTPLPSPSNPAHSVRGPRVQVGKRSFIHIEEKGGKADRMPAHHKAQEALDEYLKAAKLEGTHSPIFQSLTRAGAVLTLLLYHQLGLTEVVCTL